MVPCIFAAHLTTNACPRLAAFCILQKNPLRYFFHIGYNGFNYRGWQRLPQTDGRNVQGIIETQLSKIFKCDLAIVGCGRTDARVHAGQFFFHLDLEKSWDFDLIFRLNKCLPSDISIFDIIPVQETAHARFDAFERTYNYFIHTRKDPYLANVSSLYIEKDLRLHEMKKAVALLPMYKDYRIFSKTVPSDRSTICKVTQAELFVNNGGDNIRFEISSNRFLNGMIRIIVNKLMLIGRGKMGADEFENNLRSNEANVVNKSAYPQGLHLTHVKYPFLQLPPRSDLLRSLLNHERWTAV